MSSNSQSGYYAKEKGLGAGAIGGSGNALSDVQKMLAFVEGIAGNWQESIPDNSDVDTGDALHIDGAVAVDWVVSVVCQARRMIAAMQTNAKASADNGGVNAKEKIRVRLLIDGGNVQHVSTDCEAHLIDVDVIDLDNTPDATYQPLPYSIEVDA